MIQRIKGVQQTIPLWELPNTYVGDNPRWFEGKIPIQADNVDGFEYRVCVLFFEKFIRNHYQI